MKTYTKDEIVAVLDAAWHEGQVRLRADAITGREEKGWAIAIAHVAAKLGVAKEWHDYTPPAEARESI